MDLDQRMAHDDVVLNIHFVGNVLDRREHLQQGVRLGHYHVLLSGHLPLGYLLQDVIDPRSGRADKRFPIEPTGDRHRTVGIGQHAADRKRRFL